ncbi:unnamed protein product, partial [Sphacelaria rigidula]
MPLSAATPAVLLCSTALAMTFAVALGDSHYKQQQQPPSHTWHLPPDTVDSGDRHRSLRSARHTNHHHNDNPHATLPWGYDARVPPAWGYGSLRRGSAAATSAANPLVLGRKTAWTSRSGGGRRRSTGRQDTREGSAAGLGGVDVCSGGGDGADDGAGADRSWCKLRGGGVG